MCESSANVSVVNSRLLWSPIVCMPLTVTNWELRGWYNSCIFEAQPLMIVTGGRGSLSLLSIPPSFPSLPGSSSYQRSHGVQDLHVFPVELVPVSLPCSAVAQDQRPHHACPPLGIHVTPPSPTSQITATPEPQRGNWCQ